MERMCLKSFVKQGHRVHLYAYEPLLGVPDGVEVKSAGDIVSSIETFRFQNAANFSDYFRACLLYRRGGWWVDLDLYCLRPFEFASDYVFSSQLTVCGTNDEINCGAIKAPSGSDVMLSLRNRIEGMDTKACAWADLGPRGFLGAVTHFNLQPYVQAHTAFCPLHYFEAPANVLGRGTRVTEFGPATYGVHLWNEELRRAGEDKNGRYPESLYERLQQESGL
jgi:hypothetical protein